MPDCYHIEDELNRRLDKPVMHDDQHGTATVVLAAVLSALRETGQGDDELLCAQIGLGAAGFGIARLLIEKARNTAALLDLGDALARAGEKKQAAAVYREILSNPKLSRRSRQEIGQRLKALEN